jgi:hypothetical protein
VIPAVDPDTKLLPANADLSPHKATLVEIRQRFVEEAPNPNRRRIAFAALEIYAGLAWSYLPNAALWVDGGFVTHKESTPHDIDVVIVDDMASLDSVFAVESDALALLTFQGVSALEPNIAGIRRLQPFGGLIDGFVAPRDQPLAVSVWRDRWSMAPTPDGSGYRTDIHKGFLEVTR